MCITPVRVCMRARSVCVRKLRVGVRSEQHQNTHPRHTLSTHEQPSSACVCMTCRPGWEGCGREGREEAITSGTSYGFSFKGQTATERACYCRMLSRFTLKRTPQHPAITHYQQRAHAVPPSSEVLGMKGIAQTRGNPITSAAALPSGQGPTGSPRQSPSRIPLRLPCDTLC